MLTRPSRSACLLLAWMLSCACAVFGSDSRQIADAKAVIARAEQLSSLTQPNSAPFFFQAQVDYTPSHLAGKGGVYKLWWAGEEKWRELAEVGDAQGLEIRDAKGLWMAREMDPEVQAVLGASRVYPFRGQLVAWDEKIVGLHEHKANGISFSCVQVERPEQQRELCFDAHTGLLDHVTMLVKVHTNSKLQSFDPIEVVTEYHDYTSVGDKAVPGEIRKLVRGRVTSSLRLTKVAVDPKPPFAADLFSIPAGFEVWPACTHWHAAQLSKDFWEQSAMELNLSWFSGPGRVADAARVIVMPDGKAQEVQLIHPTGAASKEMVSAFMSQRYRPASCDGIPVVGTVVIDLSGS